MGTERKLEQRTKVDPEFSERRSVLFRLGRRPAAFIATFGIALTALLDFVTTDQLWVGPIYLIFIGLTAWSLGWRWALVATAVVTISSSLLNGASLYPFNTEATGWDYAVRLPPVMAVAAMLAHARHICDTQWRLARTDALTGTLNRKAFFELAGAIRESKGWHVLAYADLDGLKRLNDAEGHERGDAALKAFSTHVRKAIRKDDIFARIGGDEFLVYLAVRDAHAGLTVANRLHRAMNSTVSGPEQKLRCSVGALILAPGERSIDRELRAADELMYEAKHTGSALAVATARESDGGMTIAGRYMRTGAMAEMPALEIVEPDFRGETRANVSSKRSRAAA